MMATDSTVVGGDGATLGSAARALQSASDLMSESQFSRALALGSAAAKLPGCDTHIAASLATLRLVCRLHIGSSQRGTTAWQVLGLEEGATSAKVRRAFRKGAQRIHPDKCDLPGAESAFKLLAAAADTALAATPIYSSSYGGAAAGGSSPKATPASGGCWWDEWDPTLGERRQEERASKRRRPECPTAAPAVPDGDWLSNLSVKELRDEVSRRQAAILQPLPDSEEAGLDPIVRQSRLREARSLLSDRVKTEKAQNLEAEVGGFCTDSLQGLQQGC